MMGIQLGDTYYEGGYGYSKGAGVAQQEFLDKTFKRRRYSGGGGGGSRAQSIDPAVKAAQEKAEKERLQREAEEKARLAEIARKEREAATKARKEKEFSGTLAGQFQTNKTANQLSVNVAPDRLDVKPYKQSFFRSAGQSTKKLITSFYKPDQTLSYRGLIEPFAQSEDFKKDTVAYVNPVFGTIETDATGKPKTGEVTFGDIQRDIEFDRNMKLNKVEDDANKKVDTIVNKYQGKVESGEITVEEAQAKADSEIETVNKNYVDKQKKIFKDAPDVPGVFEKTGKARRIASIVPDVAVIAGSTAIGVANPVAGASIATGYFTSKGILQATDKPTYKEIALQGGLFAEGETDLDREFKGLRKEAGVNLLFGAGSGGSLALGTAGAYTKETFLAGQKAGTKTIGFEEGNILKTISKQEAPGFASITKTKNPIIDKGDGKFILAPGKQTTVARSEDFLKIIRKEKNPFIEVTNTEILQGTGKTKNILGYSENYKATVGEGIITRGKKAEQFVFGGVSAEKGNLVASIGGQAKSVRGYYSKENPFIVTVGKKSVTEINPVYERVALRIPAKDTSLIKTSKGGVDIFKDGGTGIKSFQGSGKKSSSAFLEQLYGPQTSTKFAGFGEAAAKQAQKGIQLPKMSTLTSTTRPAQAQSIYAGTGVYERTSGGLLPPGIKGSSSLKDNQIFGSNVLIGTKTGSGGVSRTRQGVGFYSPSAIKTDALITPKVKQKSGQIISPKLKGLTFQSQLFGRPTPPKPPRYGFPTRPFKPIKFGLGLPSFPLGSFTEGSGKRRKQTRRQITGYQPSLTGSVLKIKGKGVLPGALSVRGILGGKRIGSKKKPKII